MQKRQTQQHLNWTTLTQMWQIRCEETDVQYLIRRLFDVFLRPAECISRRASFSARPSRPVRRARPFPSNNESSPFSLPCLHKVGGDVREYWNVFHFNFDIKNYISDGIQTQPFLNKIIHYSPNYKISWKSIR